MNAWSVAETNSFLEVGSGVSILHLTKELGEDKFFKRCYEPSAF